VAQSRAVIFGCKGLALSTEEANFFKETRPIGFILFARNCDTPDQVRNLTSQLRSSIESKDAPILIDQEGGRVARLGPPHWRKPPAAQVFADLAVRDIDLAIEALTLNVRLIGAELRALGINVDCLPVLDIPQSDANPIIGDRAYGKPPSQVAALGRAACDALMQEGVLPIIKHIPGHGRANVDSHKALPRVTVSKAELSETDFAPFKALSDLPLAMTAHVIYGAIDATEPATTSKPIIEDIIRREIGFDGLLLSDDLSMQALSGSFAERTTATLDAGCDVVLHCNGEMDEMQEIANVVSDMSSLAIERLTKALVLIENHDTLDREAALSRLDEILAGN
jgi:beta-N-acetylhexosaminidase